MAQFRGTSGDDIITPGIVSSGVDANPFGSRPSGAADTLSGLEGNDFLDSGGGNDQLFGGEGYDTLQGGSGADTMEGGTDGDKYYVDNVGDRVVEVEDPGGDSDEVYSTISFTLPTYVENLQLEGTGNIDGTGNALQNFIFGNSGNNVLTGLIGHDWLVGDEGNDTLISGTDGAEMEGGTGNDTYIVTSAFANVIEYDGQGTDTLRSSVSQDLYDDAVGSIEIIVLTGSAAVNATGWDTDTTITGNNAANVLDGRGGNDTVIGLGGNDRLLGGTENDTLRGGAGNDFLRGLTGNDVLIGGAGNDTFGYTDVNQSTQALRDVVRAGDGATAFQGAGAAAGDRFDLAAIDADTTLGKNQTFIFDGGTGHGHLWAVDFGTTTLIRGNVDGDAAVEFEVAIEDGAVHASSYTGADFLL